MCPPPSFKENAGFSRLHGIDYTSGYTGTDGPSLNHDFSRGDAALGQKPDNTRSSQLPSGSQQVPAVSHVGVEPSGAGLVNQHQSREHSNFSFYTDVHSPQESSVSQARSSGLYSPAHSSENRSYSVDRLSEEASREEADVDSHQSSLPRLTPASNFSSLFPPPRAVTSVITTHPTYAPSSNRTQSRHQNFAHPSQAASSQPSPVSSVRYHPYAQLSGNFSNLGSFDTHSATPSSRDSSAPPSLSHSISSTGLSLVSSRSTSRSVAVSAVGSPYYDTHSSHHLITPYSDAGVARGNPSNPAASPTQNLDPSLVSSEAQSWSHSSVPSSSQVHRSATSSVPRVSPYIASRARSPFTTSQPPFHSTSPSIYTHYALKGEQEEDLKLSADQSYVDIESTGGQQTQASGLHSFTAGSSGSVAPFTQATHLPSTLGARRARSAHHRSLGHQSGYDRQKYGYTLSQRNDNQVAQLLSEFTTPSTSTRLTTMSGNMYHADVDLDTLESYDDDDVLGNLPHGTSRYDEADEYSTVDASAGGKKGEKQVRRRSSKACDQCRKSKCKCERTGDGEPCKSCMMLGTPCTFLGPSRKRGPPKGYIDAIESRLHQTEALVGIILALANPERSVLENDVSVPDERARSLLEDLRNNDPLAREIVDRVDRGAYGTKGRKAQIQTTSVNVDAKHSSRPTAGSSDERSSGSAGTVKDSRVSGSASGMSGPPASVQGRGRMVGLGQEMETSSLSTAHPSNEWQDTVTERMKAAARSRSSIPSSSSGVTAGRHTFQAPGPNDERERQRRRIDSPVQRQLEYSPERFVHSQPGHKQSMGSIGGSSDPANPLSMTTSAARYSPPVPSSFASTIYNNSAMGQPPSTASSHSSYGIDSAVDEAENVEGEEGITGGVGQLSINEEAQVRFHGKASGLHLLGQKLRVDGRNKGGIWHFPKARVWPPVAPSSTLHSARAKEAEACERAARARLPARDVQEHLLELYFTHVHPFLPIVHKQTFLRDFKETCDVLEQNKSAPKPSSSDRGRSTDLSLDSTSQGHRSSSASSAHVDDDAPNDDNREKSASGASPRISTLLLLAMFSIAARYAPVAHGTSASPGQVLLDPSRSSADFGPSQHGERSTNSNQTAPSEITAPEVETSKNPGTGITSELEADAALPDPDSGHMWAAGDGFLERAKVLLDRCYSSSRPSTCQALILMGYREIGIGAMAQSWLYIGMAVRMAQDLGMHRSSDGWSRDGEPIFTALEQQIRKRIWYACVIMDKYVSAYIGRPLSIFEADYDTRLPSVEEIEELELWSPDESTPNAILADPVEVITAPVPAFNPVPGRVISCFNEAARLSSILAMIMQAIYAVNPVSSRHLEALQLERTLDRWYMDLPEYLQFDTSVKSTPMPPSNVLTLHMQYWCVVILLHRPFIPHYIAMHRKRSQLESPVDQNAYSAAQKNFNLCVSAANHITSIVSVYQERFCLKRCSVFLSYYIFTAGIMHITAMATNLNDPQASLGLEKCMDVLKRIEIVWPSAGRAWELLNGAKDDLPDYELPLANADRPRKRSADDPVGTVLLGDPSHLHGTRDASTLAPQLYAPAAANDQRYAHAPDVMGNARALALFNSYSRWSSEDPLGFPSGLSTSVLPQQYSTGFVDDRMSTGFHHSPAAVAEGSGRYNQYWSEYSMGQPSSMLGSMYDLPALSSTNHSDQPSPHVGHDSHQSQEFQSTPLYMNDHYNVFG
ncbi:uncharacterized protein FOMMEDRAFT_131881 [Fomitiporia mediterranea MF3/22]|uniref:uncharacterized protein n=1 Tax=Fomitiporia mediterranea (strain MF3/22) TaxID=694068 RepID=UPI000440963F|nr:uncharacterized protein FOMMEDRAFT_131881 [Fomitiporia mediterranea MF3/22]EJD05321.1 hypothetical protein FOMMEDRAFT_131881 [Fomitiporia mediterranea MF3/22]